MTAKIHSLMQDADDAQLTVSDPAEDDVRSDGILQQAGPDSRSVSCYSRVQGEERKRLVDSADISLGSVASPFLGRMKPDPVKIFPGTRRQPELEHLAALGCQELLDVE